MNYTILTYSIYLAFTFLLTAWVARTLLKNGKAFLFDIFHKEQSLSDSVSNLLNVGIYLISIGFALLTLRIYRYDALVSMQNVMEALSQKLGAFIIVLGAILFAELLILLALRGVRKTSHSVTAGVSSQQAKEY